MNHCKGPWAYVPIRESRGFYLHANGYAIAKMMNDGEPVTCEANAARIKACVNAMEGVPNPAALMDLVRKMAVMGSFPPYEFGENPLDELLGTK